MNNEGRGKIANGSRDKIGGDPPIGNDIIPFYFYRSPFIINANCFLLVSHYPFCNIGMEERGEEEG